MPLRCCRSPSLRCMFVPVFRAAQAAAILPPPPEAALLAGELNEYYTWRTRTLYIRSAFRSADHLPADQNGLRHADSRPGTVQAVLAIAVVCISNAAAQQLTVNHVQSVLETGFQLRLHAYVVENTMVAAQTPIMLLVYWANLSRAAPVVAAVMAPAGPLRPAPPFVVVTTALTFVSHVTAQVHSNTNTPQKHQNHVSHD